MDIKHFLLAAVLCGAVWAEEPSISDALDNLPPSLQGKVNETQIESIRNTSAALFKEKCEKNGGPDAFLKTQEVIEKFPTCFLDSIGLKDPTVLMKEIEQAKPNGTVDEVFKKYCAKTPQAMLCVTNVTEAVKPCLSLEEQENLKTVHNITEKLREFICYKDGDRLALFIAEGGPECFQDKQEQIQECVNNTHYLVRIGRYLDEMTKLCTIFALAVFAIAAVSGNTAPTLPTYAAGENHPTSTPKGTCTDAQQRFINDTLIRMKKCYSEIINTYLGAKNASFTCTKANDLKTKWHQQFINATSCYKEKRFNESLHFFYNLLNFTTSNSEFKDFVHHNGSACVSDIRIHTNRCIRTATGRQNDTQPNIFLLGQDNKEACREIVTLKNCVVDLMKSKNCNLTGSNFIGSLTNFVTKQFCNNTQQAKITKNSAGFTTANVILTTLAAIAFYLN